MRNTYTIPVQMIELIFLIPTDLVVKEEDMVMAIIAPEDLLMGIEDMVDVKFNINNGIITQTILIREEDALTRLAMVGIEAIQTFVILVGEEDTSRENAQVTIINVQTDNIELITHSSLIFNEHQIILEERLWLNQISMFSM